MIDEIRLVEKSKWIVERPEGKYGKGWNDCNKHWIEVIKEMPKGGEWIPCSERLPDEPEFGVDGYIIQSKDIAEPYSAYWGEDEIWTDSDCNVIKDVIAWMPLPEPYKEGGAE